jgi:hypothetical protein
MFTWLNNLFGLGKTATKNEVSCDYGNVIITDDVNISSVYDTLTKSDIVVNIVNEEELVDDKGELQLGNTVPVTGLDDADPVERAKDLANTAVQIKTNDIKKAVLLMEEVIKLHPSDKYYARLAYYYHLAGRKSDCVKMHFARFELLDPEDSLSYHLGKYSVLDDIRKFHFREGDFEIALKYQCQAEWHHQVGLACQGKLSIDMLRNFKPLEGSNVKKAFKKLETGGNLEAFRAAFKGIFDSNIDTLNQLSTLSKNHDHADDKLRRESLAKNEKFQDAYQKYLSDQFERDYKEKLEPLLS